MAWLSPLQWTSFRRDGFVLLRGVEPAAALALFAGERLVSLGDGGHACARGDRVHWDADPRLPAAERLVQALVYLGDAGEALGPFECVPSLFRELPEWLLHNEVGADLCPEVSDREAVQVCGSAGDIVVWRAWLPHRRPRPSLARAITL
jgi:hypothetical protein